MTKKEKTRKTRSGRFAKGTSGNPAGRPRGSHNRATVLMEQLLAGEAEQLIEKTIELGLAGDIHALRLCLERILPPRKDWPIHLSLPPTGDAQQVSAAISKILEAIGDGILTPGEGEILTNIMEIKTKVFATGDIERRLERLEQAGKTKFDQDAADAAQPLREDPCPQAAPTPAEEDGINQLGPVL